MCQDAGKGGPTSNVQTNELPFMRSADLLVLGREVLHEPVVPLAEVWHGHVESSVRKSVTHLRTYHMFFRHSSAADRNRGNTKDGRQYK